MPEKRQSLELRELHRTFKMEVIRLSALSQDFGPESSALFNRQIDVVRRLREQIINLEHPVEFFIDSRS